VSHEQDLPHEREPPSGSIYFDDLIRRYLRTVGFKQFPTLTLLEVTRYALLAVFNVTQVHRPIGIDLNTFWDLVLPEGSYAHICLLPDTEESRSYAAESAKDAIILEGIKDVRFYITKTFLRLIWEEVKPTGASMEGNEDTYPYDGEPQDGSSANMKRIRDKIYSTMSSRHLRVMQLLFDGHSRAEVAEMMSMTVENVTKIKLKFKAKAQRLWRKGEERRT
jgi:hypothetical protein